MDDVSHIVKRLNTVGIITINKTPAHIYKVWNERNRRERERDGTMSKMSIKNLVKKHKTNENLLRNRSKSCISKFNFEFCAKESWIYSWCQTL